MCGRNGRAERRIRRVRGCRLNVRARERYLPPTGTSGRLQGRSQVAHSGTVPLVRQCEPSAGSAITGSWQGGQTASHYAWIGSAGCWPVPRFQQMKGAADAHSMARSTRALR